MEIHHRNNRRSNLILPLLLIIAATVLPSPVAAGEKVELSLYYEALCPYCENFILNYLYKIFDNGLISIVDLKLSPYGNAKLRSNGTIVCQHGEWECVLNNVEACAIHAWPVVSDHFPFIYCVESLINEEKYDEWGTCFEKLNLDPKPVTDCITSGYSYELALQYADEINALEPPHTYVPWVVVDGQPLYDDYPYFISFICKAYKGSNVPQACLGLSLPTTTPNYSAKRFNNVCYKEDVNSKSKSRLSETISATDASYVNLAESM
ncbi:gamma-interferon-responsive lysosomal thiol protein-like [Bidens hawaiensis]|uniref:gamma-interferon-responsive lysosomal thiol protein-like n=1 Tax=Bidens hawaiensis TaxID=980011 RepID=UPI00404AA05C